MLCHVPVEQDSHLPGRRCSPPAHRKQVLRSPSLVVVAAAVFVMTSLGFRAAAAAATAGFAPSRPRRAAAASSSSSSSISSQSSPSSSPSAGSEAAAMPPYEDGTVEVTRRRRRSSASAFSAVSTSKFGRKKRQVGAAATAAGIEEESFRLWYRIYRPEELKSKEKAPLVVVHGGPSLPSEYLHPLARRIPDGRAVVFYDQIGCGRSSVPADFDLYGIPQSVDDLEVLLRRLDLERFHLLGHSYGGALAYEYVKRASERAGGGRDPSGGDDGGAKGEGGSGGGAARRSPLSLLLSNASTSMKLSDDERTRLYDRVRAEMRRNPAALADDEIGMTASEVFFRRNQCRVRGGMPPPLRGAFRHVGGVWAGTDVVMDYVAAPTAPGAASLPPVLIVRGEHDFVTKKCTEGWAELFGKDRVRERVLGGCAHYCHLEEPETYGGLVESFCAEHD